MKYLSHLVRLTAETCDKVKAFSCNHEEVDTRLFLHAPHAAKHEKTIILVADGTGMLIISLSRLSEIDSNIFIRRGTKTGIS